MKKIFIVIIIIIGIIIFKDSSLSESIIPDEAIRLRVLANSNTIDDQNIKRKVSEELQIEMYDKLKDTNNIEDARVIIKNNLDSFRNNINNVLVEEDYKLGFNIDFGKHYFPNKEYKGVTYKEGYYESILVKLGSGKGNNWWCVLFPPLCLIEAEEASEVEYKFFIQELIDKYF